MKKVYLVVACSECERFQLARQGVKSKRCPYCGRRVNLTKTEPHWTTDDIEEARSVLHSKRRGKSADPTLVETRKRVRTHF